MKTTIVVLNLVKKITYIFKDVTDVNIKNTQYAELMSTSGMKMNNLRKKTQLNNYRTF